MSYTPSIGPESPQLSPAVSSKVVREDVSDSGIHKIAHYPFDNIYSDADVILQASDGTHFYVHKSTMRVASRFFSEMFSLPQPPPASAPSAGPGASLNLEVLPILPVTEDSNTLQTLLRLCYPVEQPAKHDTQTLADVLKAALKYQMRVITASLTQALLCHMPTNPLYVFAIAYKCDLFQVAANAFRKFTAFEDNPPVPFMTIRGARGHKTTQRARTVSKRKHSLDEYSPELDSLPGGVYYRLLEQHATAKDPSSYPPSLSQSDDINATVRAIVSRPWQIDPVHVPESPRLTGRLQHPFQVEHGTDTIIRSSDYVKFHVHRSFLAFASPVFARMLDPPALITSSSDSPNTTDRDIPRAQSVHTLPEDGQTLSKLLQLSYPLPDPEVTNLGPADAALGSAISLLHAARKYEVSRAIAFAKQACVAAAKERPVQLYLIASRYKWYDVARDAAMRAVYETSDQYLPEMEDISAADYRRLLIYRQECRDIILSGGEPTSSVRGDITPPAYRARNVHAPYWSTSHWLSCPEEARFWRSLHEYVNKNTAQEPGPWANASFIGNIEAMLPRSVVDDDRWASRGRLGDEQIPIPEAAAPIAPEAKIPGQDELERIAHALAKVRGRLRFVYALHQCLLDPILNDRCPGER